MDHRRTVHKTPLDIIWNCSCGWMTWQRRAQNALRRNAKLLDAWRAHLVRSDLREAPRCC